MRFLKQYVFQRFAALCAESRKNIGDVNIIYKRAKVFRHIQVLNTLLNEIQKGPPMIVYISALVVLGAMTLTTIIASPNSDTAVIMILLWINCFVGISIVLGQMAMVNQKTSGLLSTIRTKRKSPVLSIQDRKWEDRFYRSCLGLKVMISSVNFVDELTPLNCFDMSISTTVNLLLLSGSSG